MSFIEKLRTLGIKKENQEKVAITQGSPPSENEGISEMEKVIQLSVDILQTPYELILYAFVPGVNSKNLDIFLEDQGDVLTIKGKRERPEDVFLENGDSKAEENKWLLNECQWGTFYRRILLSQEVNASQIEAKLKNGILVLRLPFIKVRTGKKKINILEEK